MPLDKINENQNERLSAQEVLRTAMALQKALNNSERYPLGQGFKEEVIRLQDKLKTQIRLWGGKDKVDEWLHKNDPLSNQLRRLTEIDWSFLNPR